MRQLLLFSLALYTAGISPVTAVFGRRGSIRRTLRSPAAPQWLGSKPVWEEVVFPKATSSPISVQNSDRAMTRKLAAFKPPTGKPSDQKTGAAAPVWKRVYFPSSTTEPPLTRVKQTIANANPLVSDSHDLLEKRNDVDDVFGGNFEHYVDVIIDNLQQSENIPKDHPIWDGVRTDFRNFHADDLTIAGSVGKKLEKSKRSVPGEIHEKAARTFNEAIFYDKPESSQHDCTIHLLEYDESVSTIKIFYHTPLCLEEKESELQEKFNEAEIERSASENSVMLVFTSAQQYDVAYRGYHNEIKKNDGIEVDLSGISGWNPDYNTNIGFGKMKDFEHSGYTYEEVLKLLESNNQEEEDKNENGYNVDEPFDEEHFEEVVQKIVDKLQIREDIPRDDPIWRGVREDFAEFLYGKNTESYREVISREVDYGNRDEEKENNNPTFSTAQKYVNWACQILAVVLIVILVCLFIKHRRQRRLRRNVVLPISVDEIRPYKSETLSCSGNRRGASQKQLQQIRMGLKQIRAESAPPRCFVVESREPTPSRPQYSTIEIE